MTISFLIFSGVVSHSVAPSGLFPRLREVVEKEKDEVWCGVGTEIGEAVEGVVDSSPSFTSTITTVVLSFPPLELANRTSCSAASCGLSTFSRMCRISAADTSLLRPSVHKRKRSSLCIGTSQQSTFASTSIPSARVMIFRWGWLSASFSVMNRSSDKV